VTAEAPIRARLLVGFDGSHDAERAIEVGALLFAGAQVTIAHVWMPPFTAHPSPELLRRAGTVDGLIELLQHQGRLRSEDVTRKGVAVAADVGWDARPANVRSFAGEGLELARLAEQLRPDALIVGARGLSGVRAMLGSVSDAVAHYSPVPVLVVPPRDSRRAARSGPVLVGYDGSAGADTALTTARALWPTRRQIAASVGCQAVEKLPAERAVARAVLEPHGVGASARAVADALAQHADRIGAAVIVVGSRGRSAHREVLLGSVAMATLHHGHRPVLAVPPPNRLALPPGPADRAAADG
jgi:nucleotide-binding universal stress UspA family protein